MQQWDLALGMDCEKAVPISPNHAQFCCRVLPCCIPGHGQNPSQNSMSPHCRGWVPYSVTWPSCDEHTTMHLSGCLISMPTCWKAWDLGVPTLIFIYLCPYFRLMLL